MSQILFGRLSHDFCSELDSTSEIDDSSVFEEYNPNSNTTYKTTTSCSFFDDDDDETHSEDIPIDTYKVLEDYKFGNVIHRSIVELLNEDESNQSDEEWFSCSNTSRARKDRDTPVIRALRILDGHKIALQKDVKTDIADDLAQMSTKIWDKQSLEEFGLPKERCKVISSERYYAMDDCLDAWLLPNRLKEMITEFCLTLFGLSIFLLSISAFILLLTWYFDSKKIIYSYTDKIAISGAMIAAGGVHSS